MPIPDPQIKRKRIALQGDVLKVGASVGIALCPQHGQDPNTLLSRADNAMYRAKKGVEAPGLAADEKSLAVRLTLNSDEEQARDDDDGSAAPRPLVAAGEREERW